jgi:hypothetical protein
MSDVWLGILLSIPIGIATSLVTPWIQRKLDQLDQRRALAATGRQVQEFERIKAFKSNPDQFTQYLIQVAIRTTLTGAFIALLSGIMFALGQTIMTMKGSDLDYVRNAAFLLGQFVTLLGSLLIINICRPALRAWTSLQNFEQFNEKYVKLLNGDRTGLAGPPVVASKSGSQATDRSAPGSESGGFGS